MVEVWAFDMGSGTPGNCAEFLRAGLAAAARQALKAFPESFGYDTGHGFARLLSDGCCEAMRFRVFDVEGFHAGLSVKPPRFYRSTISWADVAVARGRGWPPAT